MIKSFITSFKLRNTYRANSIIYSIKQFPIINKILPNSLYKNKGLKIFANIMSILIEFIFTFLGKFLYIWFVIFSMLTVYSVDKIDLFLHIFLFLTIGGAFMNTYMLNPTKDKYYAIVLMNFDAKKYGLSNYYYQLLRVIIGFMPFTIYFGLMINMPLWLCILLPFFVVAVKLVIMGYCVLDFKKTGKAKNENIPTTIVWSTIAVCVLLAYGSPAINVTINQMIFLCVFSFAVILGICSLKVINSFKDYRKMYKQVLTETNVYAVDNNTGTKAMKDNSLKQIELGNSYTSNKTGFAFFHEIFVKRHSKILTKAVKKQSVIILLIFAVLFILIKINPLVAERMNRISLVYLPYFVFIMYLINRSSSVTQAMFMNCDHSMLTYRVYRTPKAILGVFKERLKTLILINLLPAILISLGLAMTLYLSGGTDNPVNYLVIIVSIISMSIFFSVHYLVMYYLLQPYNASIEMKSSTYKAVQYLTYFVAYFFMRIKMPTLYFGIAMSIFCVGYSLISLFIAYKYAPKTFKLRI